VAERVCSELNAFRGILRKGGGGGWGRHDAILYWEFSFRVLFCEWDTQGQASWCVLLGVQGRFLDFLATLEIESKGGQIRL
jgi:hypothetical protein